MELQKTLTNTTLKIGYVGIGNAGSQVGVELSRNGFETILVNTSTKDLDSSIISSDIKCYLIGDSNETARGAGHSRDNAKKIYNNSTDKVIKDGQFIDFINENDITVIGCSTAGGTGSGITPTLTYQLKNIFPNKVFIILGILPRLTESPNAHFNTSTFVDEVNNLSKNGCELTYMMYDLEKYKDYASDDAYKKLAKEISKAFGIMRGDMSYISNHGMVDERDMLTILSTPGLINIYFKTDIDLNKVPDGGVQKILTDQIKTSPCVTQQKDKLVKWFGIFLLLPEDIDDDVRRNDFRQLETAIGNPGDTFVNHAVTDKPKGEIAVIASGLTFPFDRIDTSLDIVKTYTDGIKTKTFDIHGELDGAKLFAKNDSVNMIMSSKNKVSAEDIKDVTIPSFLDTDF
jgi:hypothetical protein